MNKTKSLQIKCSKCKTETHTNRYYCRSCDAKRVAAYRSTPKGRRATTLAYKKWASRNPERVKELQKMHRLSKGGSHTPDNLQLTHPVCNLRKHNKTPEVAYA